MAEPAAERLASLRAESVRILRDVKVATVEGLAIIREAMGDSDRAVRGDALRALEAHSELPEARVLADVVAAMWDQPFELRARILARLGERDLLLGMIEHGQRVVRVPRRSVFAAHARAKIPAYLHTVAALQRRQERREALVALSTIKTLEAQGLLLRLLLEEPCDLREARIIARGLQAYRPAAVALWERRDDRWIHSRFLANPGAPRVLADRYKADGSCGDGRTLTDSLKACRATHGLIEVSNDDDPVVRCSAVAALGSRQDQPGVEGALRARLGDWDPTVRGEAVRGLPSTLVQETYDALTLVLEQDRDQAVRAAAMEKLGELAQGEQAQSWNGPVRIHLGRYLGHPKLGQRAVRWLTRLGDARGLKALAREYRSLCPGRAPGHQERLQIAGPLGRPSTPVLER